MSHEDSLTRTVVVNLGPPLSHDEYHLNVKAAIDAGAHRAFHSYEEHRDAALTARIAEAVDLVMGVGKDAGFLMVYKDASDIYVPPPGPVDYRILGGTPALDIGWRIDNNELSIIVGPAPEWLKPLNQPSEHAAEILWRFQVAPATFVEKVTDAVDAMATVIDASLDAVGVRNETHTPRSPAIGSRLLVAARTAVEASNSLFEHERPIAASERRPLMKAIVDEYLRGNQALGRSIVMPYLAIDDEKPCIELREWLTGEVVGRRQILKAELFSLNLAMGDPRNDSLLLENVRKVPLAIPMHLATSSLLKKESLALRGSGIRPLVLANAGDADYLDALSPMPIQSDEMIFG